MALRDILVCLDSSRAGETRLKLALHLARQHRASLVGVYELADGGGPLFEPRETAVAAPLGGGGVGVLERPIAESVPREAMRAEDFEERFRSMLRLHNIDGDWHLVEERDTAHLIGLTKSVDLAVLGQFSRDNPHGTRFRPDEIATACGRPLLIVPYVGDFATVGEHVLIAWDETREATRALNDCLPLLASAQAVTVMTVIASEKQFDKVHYPLQRVVSHLERHGIPVRGEESMRGDMTISDLILSRAADIGADMIVAGAYHHSQWREALVGGVSRDLLRHMTVPVLMSH
jgi:nucleotide-binding universal stress UspA family protein